jgi:hypothetical protein
VVLALPSLMLLMVSTLVMMNPLRSKLLKP